MISKKSRKVQEAHLGIQMCITALDTCIFAERSFARRALDAGNVCQQTQAPMLDDHHSVKSGGDGDKQYGCDVRRLFREPFRLRSLQVYVGVVF